MALKSRHKFDVVDVGRVFQLFTLAIRSEFVGKIL